MKSQLLKIIGFAGLVLFSLPAYTQYIRDKSVAEEALEIKTSSATVLEWLTLLEQKGYQLSYSSSRIDLNEKVTLSGRPYTVDGFLKSVLHAYDFTARYTGSRKILLQVRGFRTIRLKGSVLNDETGENLLGFAVVLQDAQGKKYMGRADSQGHYVLNVPPGRYKLLSSYIGFKPVTVPLHLTQDRDLTVRLHPLSTPIEEVIIQPAPFTDEANYQGTSGKLSVSHKDPLASVSFMPGVTGSAVNGNLYVNGGEKDENLILLDGIPLYHSQHNNSLLALFNGDAVRKISFYSSFIPARYEGRLSSVTDVRLKEGDSLVHRQYLNLEMPSASMTFEGPIIKNRLTYMISGRHSWMDFMEGLFDDQPGLNRSFSDLTCKLTYRISPTTSVYGLAYRSNDILNDSTDYSKNQKVLQWRGGVYSLGMHTLIRNRIDHTVHVGYSEYINRVFAPIMQMDSPIFIEEGMNRFIFNSDYRMNLDRHVEVSWGLKFSREKFNLIASKDTLENNNHYISQVSSYANAKLRITPRLTASAALNVVSYIPKHDPSFFSLQPRFTLKYQLNQRNSLSVDFSRMEQFYHNICIGEIPLPLDFRMPSIKGFKPSSSFHLEAGWRYIQPRWFCSLAAYYKRRSNILGMRYDIVPENEEWDRLIMKGDAHSGGLKFRLSANLGRWSSDISYTYARSKEWFADYDAGRKHPALQDIPHIFNWGTSYSVGKQSYFTLGGYVRSGYFSTIFLTDGSANGLIRRSARGRCNYRLDLSFMSSKSDRRKKVELHYKVGLYNIVGNPRNEEILDLYSLDTKKHCLPYVALNLAF